MLECIKNMAKPHDDMRWIPVTERLPEDDKYIMVSFENFTLPDIGRYEVDKDGNGVFYPGDDEKSYAAYGLFVNAWMPLPDPYREREKSKNVPSWKNHIMNRFLKGE